MKSIVKEVVSFAKANWKPGKTELKFGVIYFLASIATMMLIAILINMTTMNQGLQQLTGTLYWLILIPITVAYYKVASVERKHSICAAGFSLYIKYRIMKSRYLFRVSGTVLVC